MDILNYALQGEHEIFLNEEHRALRRTLREFTDREVAPYIREWDRAQEFQPGILTRLGEVGVLGICIPQKYGGAGMDYFALAVACEELERADTFLRVIMSVHVGLNSLALFQWGTAEQKERFLTPQARGLKYAAYCLTEPNAG